MHPSGFNVCNGLQARSSTSSTPRTERHEQLFAGNSDSTVVVHIVEYVHAALLQRPPVLFLSRFVNCRSMPGGHVHQGLKTEGLLRTAAAARQLSVTAALQHSY